MGGSQALNPSLLGKEASGNTLVRVYVGPSTLEGEVRAPPSKSYTHRAFAAALLAEGEGIVERPLISSDTLATTRACRMLGAKVSEDEAGARVSGSGFILPDDVIDAENSGTTLRFFTAISSLAPPGHVILTGDASLRKRPMQPLLDALKHLGVECWSARGNGCAPVIVRAGGMRGGAARVKGGVSSQFISALLLASVKAQEQAVIWVEGQVVSKPYIDATLEVLDRYGFRVVRKGYTLFEVEPEQTGKPAHFKVPGDFGSASFILAGAHLTGGWAKVNDLDPTLPQADMRILEILREFGSNVRMEVDAVSVYGVGGGGGGVFTLTDSPDLVPIVASLAAKSGEETVIKGVEHARFKESDRLTVTAHELSKLGVQVQVTRDGLRIRGSERLRGGVQLDAHGDHRLFMALAVLAASTKKGCVIEGAEWAAVSYPQFLRHLKALGVTVKEAKG